jgi:hypothetical protein
VAAGGLHPRAEEREHLGIDAIGLGQSAERLAKSRTWRGFTTATGRAAVTSAATTGAPEPPVASTTTSKTGWACAAWTNALRPAESVANSPVSPGGSLARVTEAFATSRPR